MLLIGLGVLLILGLVWWCSSKKASFEGEKKPEEKNERKPLLVLFWATWCGHCEHFMPTWNKAKEVLRTVEMKDIESKNPELKTLGANVSSFPTIRLFPEGIEKASVYVDYHGDRSVEDLDKFVKEVTTTKM